LLWGGHAGSAAPSHGDRELPSQSAPVKWRAKFAARGVRPPIGVADNAIFVTTGEGLLIFDSATGRRAATFKPSEDPLTAPAIAAKVAVVADRRFLYAVDRHGKERWRYSFGKAATEME